MVSLSGSLFSLVDSKLLGNSLVDSMNLVTNTGGKSIECSFSVGRVI